MPPKLRDSGERSSIFRAPDGKKRSRSVDNMVV
jgi:hypothetical protein